MEPFEQRLEHYARHVNAPYVQFLRRAGLAKDFVRAEGAAVWDASGRRYVDAIAGYGNLNLGHNHPAVVGAVVRELVSPRPFNHPFISDAHAQFAARLAEFMPPGLDRTFIVNSGSEAVDTAIKLVRLATGKPHIVAAQGAWHGFTLGALSVSEPSMVRPFLPLLPTISHVPYGDANAVEAAIGDHTGAVIVEAIQSESGAVVPPDRFLSDLRELCSRRNALLVLDEVKSGVAKTGRFFAFNWQGIEPDIVIAGKALGGGVMPIGTVTAGARLWAKFGLSFPMSSSSGAGNAPACAAGLATLDVVEREGLVNQADAKGSQVLQVLRTLSAEFPTVCTGASGRGLLLALHTSSLNSANNVVAGCISRGLLVMNAFCDRTKVLFEPPLAISEPDLELAIEALRAAVAASH